MSEETKKVEKTEREVKSAELSDKDLEQIAGGAANPDQIPPWKGGGGGEHLKVGS